MSRGTLYFITSNKDKLGEVIAILGQDFPFKVIIVIKKYLDLFFLFPLLLSLLSKRVKVERQKKNNYLT